MADDVDSELAPGSTGTAASRQILSPVVAGNPREISPCRRLGSSWCSRTLGGAGRRVAVLLLLGMSPFAVRCGGHHSSADRHAAKRTPLVAPGWTTQLGPGSTGRLRVTRAPRAPVRDRALAVIGEIAQVDPSGVARVQLRGGRLGSSGAVLTRRLSGLLADGDTATLMYFDADAARWRAVPSTVSVDRRAVSARVHHFSDWAAAVLHGSAQLLGSRADAPDCGSTPRPSWVDTVTYLDDQNAPLRVCVGGDPAGRKRIRLKVAVNRGYGMSMHTATDPTDTAIDLGDGPINLIADGVVRVPTLVQLITRNDDHNLPALARETATFSFTEAQVRIAGTGAPLARARLTPFEAAAGTIFDLIVGAVTKNETQSGVARAAAYIGAYATVAQCVGDIITPFSAGHWTAAIAGARKCLSDSAETVSTLTARALTEAFPSAGHDRIAAISGKVGRVLRALGLISVGLDATEWLNDHRLDAAGFEISVFPQIKRTVFTPDTNPKTLITADSGNTFHVGPYAIRDVFAYAENAPGNLSDVEAKLGSDDRCTGAQNDITVVWPKIGVSGFFTTLGAFSDAHGNAITEDAVTGCDHRDQIEVDRLTATAAHWHTRAGLKIGDPLSRLQRLYPAAAEQGGEWWLHTAKSPFGGNGGEIIGDLTATVTGSVITALTVHIDAEGD